MQREEGDSTISTMSVKNDNNLLLRYCVCALIGAYLRGGKRHQFHLNFWKKNSIDCFDHMPFEMVNVWRELVGKYGLNLECFVEHRKIEQKWCLFELGDFSIDFDHNFRIGFKVTPHRAEWKERKNRNDDYHFMHGFQPFSPSLEKQRELSA